MMKRRKINQTNNKKGYYYYEHNKTNEVQNSFRELGNNTRRKR